MIIECPFFMNKEVFVKHEKAPTAPRFQGVFTNSNMPMFRKQPLFLVILANFGHFQWSNLAKKCQKAHLQAITFHMSLFPGLYDHPFVVLLLA